MTPEEVYISFRRAQAFAKNRPYRLPKNWDKHFNTKMNKVNREALTKLSEYTITKWSNIDIDRLMQYGFELWKNFSYHQFLDRRLMSYYIEKDKLMKRSIKISKQKILLSFMYIKKYMKDNQLIDGYNILQSYCKLKDNHQRVIIRDYIKGKIDNILLIYCIHKKYLVLTDLERIQVFNITNKYNEYEAEMLKIKNVIEKMEKEL